jgi:membrane protease YdiL (CAAX protease family)
MTTQRRLLLAVAVVALGTGALVSDTACAHVVAVLALPSWVERLYLLPLALGLALYFAVGTDGTWRMPSKDFTRRAKVVMILIWIGAAALVSAFHVGVYGRGVLLDAVGLMVTHVVAQELLFRGALVGLAMRLWPAAPGEKDPLYGKALLLSAIVFGAAQLQYHGFELTKPALIQAARATVIGLLLATARLMWRSLWPGATFHAINNFLFLARR